MSVSDLSDTILSYVAIYGVSALCLAIFLAALGLPVPSTFCVLAGGAFVQQGVLDLPSTIVLALLGAVLGDTLSYSIGRVLRRPIQRRYGHSPTWLKAEAYVARRGGLAIYLTRWLLTPIAIPVNLVAGSSGYSLRRFLGYDTAGETTWILGYGTLGYVFGSQWETVSDFVSNFSGLLVGVALAAIGVYLLVRWLLRPSLAPAPLDVSSAAVDPHGERG
jgi:membrane protein DedA with SNARE-associated domain